MLARIEAISARHDTHIANIAHAGDGNLHPLLITPHDDEAARRRAQAALPRSSTTPSSWAEPSPVNTASAC